jgi:hypothetical protein
MFIMRCPVPLGKLELFVCFATNKLSLVLLRIREDQNLNLGSSPIMLGRIAVFLTVRRKKLGQ